MVLQPRRILLLHSSLPLALKRAVYGFSVQSWVVIGSDLYSQGCTSPGCPS